MSVYEWQFCELDEHGDTYDVHHFDALNETGAKGYLEAVTSNPPTVRLRLVEYTRDGNRVDDYYVERLAGVWIIHPKHARIPRRYHDGLSRWQRVAVEPVSPRVRRMQDGRVRMAARCEMIAEKARCDAQRITGLRVVWEPRKALSGYACLEHAGHYTIAAPYPRTVRSLHVYLHEIAHVVLGHTERKYRGIAWKRELAAETWALKRIESYGIKIPASVQRSVTEYVTRVKLRGERAKHQHTFVWDASCMSGYGCCACGKYGKIEL